MNNKHFLWAILLLVIVNVVVLGGVWQNRSDNTDATVILTEREIRPYRNYGYNRNREDSCVSLKIRTNDFVAIEWFDQAKLEEVGFTFNIRPNDRNAYRYYRRRPTKKAYVVLEYEGDAWRKFREGAEEERDGLEEEASLEGADQNLIKNKLGQIERKLNYSSRLFVVDVGKDPKKLRKRYDERSSYIITPAEVGIRFEYYGSRKDKKNKLVGTIRKILNRTIHVPFDKRDILDSLESKAGGDKYRYGSGYGNYAPPRYKVLVQYGSRYEPWIGRVELLEPPTSISDGK